VLSAEVARGADLHLYFRPHGKNSEIYREFFEFNAEIAEFCPKYPKPGFGTGN
jgi:hypothetical protein